MQNFRFSHLSAVALITFFSLNSVQAITLSKGISSSLREKIEKDLATLDHLKFKDSENSEASKLMGLNPLSAASARAWLDRRVQYIVEQDVFDTLNPFKKILYVEREGVTFPYPNVVPYALIQAQNAPVPEKPKNEEGKKEPGIIIMSNIGSALYLEGKIQSAVLGMKISRGVLKKPLKVAIESPRTGIIQIGEGLFSPYTTVNRENPDSLANSLHRLGTFFHEARHGDGHGSSLSFMHSLCPAGHNLAGLPACDENLNGPYAIEAALMAEMIKNCDTCTLKEKEVLKIVTLSSLSRVLKVSYKGEPTTHWDGTPEGL